MYFESVAILAQMRRRCLLSLASRSSSIMAPKDSRPCNVGPVPDIDQKSINDAWTSYLTKADAETGFLWFQEYSRARSKQVDMSTMLKVSSLVLIFRQLNTNGRFKPTMLEAGLVHALEASPKNFNRSGFDTASFASAVCTKFLVVLAHSRYVNTRRAVLIQQISPDRHDDFHAFCEDLAACKIAEDPYNIISHYNININMSLLFFNWCLCVFLIVVSRFV